MLAKMPPGIAFTISSTFRTPGCGLTMATLPPFGSIALRARTKQRMPALLDRKSTRLNSSHTEIYTLSLHDALHDLEHLPYAGLWIDDGNLAALRLDRLACANETADAGAAEIFETTQVKHQAREARPRENAIERLVEIGRRVGIEPPVELDGRRVRAFGHDLQRHVADLSLNRGSGPDEFPGRSSRRRERSSNRWRSA